MTENTKPGSGTSFSAHPPGLRTLFFTEMWERFSYYGMRALLVLFMVDAVNSGGMGLTDETATAIYGLYTAAVYFMALPGGWVADRLIGAQRSVWYGGIVIMLGHFTLAIPSVTTFFLGLLLVVVGTGLLKPNISALVGELYAPGDPRRDSGFTLYYMGINVGAAIGPLICSTLGESDQFGWHYGFAAAGVGMLAGLIQFRLSQHRLKGAGAAPTHPGTQRHQLMFLAGVIAIVLLAGAFLSGLASVNPVDLAQWTTTGIVLLAVIYFAWLLSAGGLDQAERKRVVVIILLFLGSAMFWAGFEQAGSSLNLFAERYTDRLIGSFEIPAGWFQTLNPVFIIVLAPVFAAGWVSLSQRNLSPSTLSKFGFGFAGLALGFLVMMGAARLVSDGGMVAPWWLISTYLLHTMGELALSPVGLSATTRLAPKRFVGQMMGLWFLGASVGNLVAGLVAGRFTQDALTDMPGLYLQIVLISAGCGLLFFALSKPVGRWTDRAG